MQAKTAIVHMFRNFRFRLGPGACLCNAGQGGAVQCNAEAAIHVCGACCKVEDLQILGLVRDAGQDPLKTKHVSAR